MQRTVRMKRELEMLEKDPPPQISCWMKEDKVDHFRRTIKYEIIGGEKTPYQGGIFKVDIQIPERYPFEPPKMRFETPIYHPNIDTAGRICLDILKMPPSGAWKPSLNLSTVLTSLQLLMAEPNPEDPLMSEIADEFKQNKHAFEQKAKDWTERHAKSDAVLAGATKQLNQSDSSSDSDSDSDQSDDSSDEENNRVSNSLANQKCATKRPAEKRVLLENNSEKSYKLSKETV